MAKPAKKQSPATGTGTATPWLAKIDSRLEAEKSWRTDGRKVVSRYRDERAKTDLMDDSRINILWANTELLEAALYNRTAKPDVRRRFPDSTKGNSASRAAAEVLERALHYVLDTENVDDELEPAIEDMLLPGRGEVWVTYEPEIEEPEDDDTDEDAEDDAAGSDSIGGEEGAQSGEKVEAGGKIVNQRLRVEYVYWEDYCQGVARKDSNVPWRARRHALTKDEFEERFPEAKSAKLKGGYKLTTTSDIGGNSQQDGDFIEVWEIWAKGGKRRMYAARGYADLLDEAEDPYGLTTFFPCPTPLRGVTTTDRQVPQPEYLLYQDQALEVDRLQTRIHKLTEQVKWRGIYDATIPDGGSPGSSTLADMSKADDGDFLPHSNYQQVRDRGGIAAAFGFMPIQEIAQVITELDARLDKLINQIWQITGIADIMRGSTDPNETAKAQGLKAQFGSLRLQRRQRRTQAFIRDTYRILAEIIAEHFTQETLAEITNMDLPTAAEQMQAQQQVQLLQAQAQQPPPPQPMPPTQGPMPGQPLPPQQMPPPGPAGQDSGGAAQGLPTPQPSLPAASQDQPSPSPPDIPPDLLRIIDSPTWEDVMQILRSDKVRGYRVDVETDNTMQDEDADKQRRIEAVTAINELLEKAYLAATNAPKTLPLIKEIMLFGMRTFKAARGLEETVEDAFDELEKNPPQPQGPAPSQDIPPDMKAMLEQNKLAMAEKKLHAETQYQASSLQIEQAHKQGSLQIEAQRMQAETEHRAQMAQLEAQKLDHSRQSQAASTALEAQKLEHERQAHAQTMALEGQKLAHTQATSASDMTLRTAAHNKALLDETDASSGDGAGGPVLKQIMDGLTQVVQTVTQGQQQVAAALIDGQKQIAAEQANQAQQTAQLISLVAAPKRVVRGPDGKASGVETVTH